MTSSCSSCPCIHSPLSTWSWNPTNSVLQSTQIYSPMLQWKSIYIVVFSSSLQQVGFQSSESADTRTATNNHWTAKSHTTLKLPAVTHTIHTCECAHTHFRPHKSDLILKVPKYYSAVIRMWLCLYLRTTFIRNSISRNKEQWKFFFFFLEEVVRLIKLLKICFRKKASWQMSVSNYTFMSSCL